MNVSFLTGDVENGNAIISLRFLQVQDWQQARHHRHIPVVSPFSGMQGVEVHGHSVLAGGRGLFYILSKCPTQISLSGAMNVVCIYTEWSSSHSRGSSWAILIKSILLLIASNDFIQL